MRPPGTITGLQGLDFADFAAKRQALLAGDPGLVDAANAQLYQVLPLVDPVHFAPIAPSNDPKAAHRCHLAEALCQHLGLDEDTWKRRCLVSQGVRDSLAIMMRVAASEGSTLWLPHDVYPVYLDLARQAGATVRTYSAREGLDVQALAGQTHWTLLVCDPLKPWGGALAHDARERLVALARQAEGNILVDGAYGPGFDAGWRAHIERDDPVALLLSVSKGWLLPYRGGAAIAGDGFSSNWKSAFAANRCNTDGLRQAFAALTMHGDRPGRVNALVDRARRQMISDMAAVGVELEDPGQGYFVACQIDADNLAARGVLAMPASVFGSTHGGCVLSCLAWARPEA